MFASDAAHVPLINAAFAPTPAELADAEAIVSAFALSPYAERLQVHGRMIDQPRLQAAKALLGVA
jgi:citrate lyase subunit beta/citryl-CoA lyase